MNLSSILSSNVSEYSGSSKTYKIASNNNECLKEIYGEGPKLRIQDLSNSLSHLRSEEIIDLCICLLKNILKMDLKDYELDDDERSKIRLRLNDVLNATLDIETSLHSIKNL
ncbi:10124_t:CDS:1 [Gigaspora rosea]|nr:10124_t:CDS:1 [Gigaspora rosea]